MRFLICNKLKMRKYPGYRFFLIPVLMVLLAAAVRAQSTLPYPEHIVIVIEENHSFVQVSDSSAAPYINQLMNDSHTALFTASFALIHPSQPNYLMLFSGSHQNVLDDNVPGVFPFTTHNLGSALLQKGRTFKGYSEDLPITGYNGAVSGSYARKHNPWVNWQNSEVNGIPDTCNVPLSDFPEDFSRLPDVSFIIPNLRNDMHDGTDPERISTGDTWLRQHADNYIQWAKTHNSLFILTFDEDDDHAGNNILTLFIGQNVKKGVYNRYVDHYILLRTIEDMYGLTHSGAADSAAPIDYCWQPLIGVVSGNNFRASNEVVLHANYPNPFNGSTRISYTVNVPGTFVRLAVYDCTGKVVEKLDEGIKTKGTFTAVFSGLSAKGHKAASGVYFCELLTSGSRQVAKMILLP